MKIRFSADLEDHLPFHHWHAETRPRYWLTIWLYRIGYPLVAVTLVLFNKGDLENRYFLSAVIGAGFGVFSFFYVPYITQRRREQYIRQMKAVRQLDAKYGVHDVELTENEIHEECNGARTDWPLAAIDGLVRLPSYSFVLHGNRAIIISKKKISAGDAKAFEDALAARIGMGKVIDLPDESRYLPGAPLLQVWMVWVGLALLACGTLLYFHGAPYPAN